jgi:hypothetical protein
MGDAIRNAAGQFTATRLVGFIYTPKTGASDTA